MSKICPHYHAIIYSNSEKGKESYLDRNAQVNGMDLKKLAHIDAKKGEIKEPTL